MNKVKKRLIFFIFVFLQVQFLAMIISPIPSSAANSIVYEPMTTEYGIFNKYNYFDKDFYDYYTNKDRPYFNTLEKFGLFLGTRYIKFYDVSYTWKDFAYTTSESGEKNYTIYGRLANSQQQLKVSIRGTLKNHEHSHGSIWEDGIYKTHGYQAISLKFANSYVSNVIAGNTIVGKATVKTVGGVGGKSKDDTNYLEVYPYYYDKSEYDGNLDLFFNILSTNYPCFDGNVYAEDLAVTFADTKDPKISNFTFLDEKGNKCYLYSAGDPFCLKLEFDEPIRFADNSPEHGDIYIKLSDANGFEIKGYLTELKDNYLIFKFDDTSLSDIPEGARDTVFTTLDLTPLFGDRNWELKDILGQKALSKGATLASQFRSSDNKSRYGYDKSLCLITDIAGNPFTGKLSGDTDENDYPLPLEKQTYVLPYGVYIDGIAPEVNSIGYLIWTNNRKVKMALGKSGPEAIYYDPESPTNYADKDNMDDSDTHLGPGDKIQFFVSFTEHLLADDNYIPDKFTGMKAILNVNDESGNPVELSSIEAKTLTGIAYPETKQPGFKRYKTKVTFEPFIINENYTYEEPRIKIKQIVADGIRITDLSGNNEYDCTTDLTGSNTNSVYIDVVPPVVKANLEPNEGVYTPVAEKSEGEKITQFYFPYEVSKSSDTDEESDVIGILGSFHWYNGTEDPDEEYYKFMYAVTASPNPPEDDDIAKDQYDDGWHVGYTGFYSNNPIKQISSNNYLHIRLIDGVDYNLKSTTLEIIANDYAGASANESFMLDFTGDGKKPSIPAANVQKVYDDATKTGTMTVTVNVTDDNSGLKGIWYMWVSRGSDAPASDDPGWTEAGSFNEGDNSILCIYHLSDINGADFFQFRQKLAFHAKSLKLLTRIQVKRF